MSNVSKLQTPTTQRRLRFHWLYVALLLLFSAYFFWLWYTLYLSIEFNALGRYYDAENQVVYTDSAFVWGILAFGFLFLALGLIMFRFLKHRRLA